MIEVGHRATVCGKGRHGMVAQTDDLALPRLKTCKLPQPTNRRVSHRTANVGPAPNARTYVFVSRFSASATCSRLIRASPTISPQMVQGRSPVVCSSAASSPAALIRSAVACRGPKKNKRIKE